MSQLCKHGREVYCPFCEDDREARKERRRMEFREQNPTQPATFDTGEYLYSVQHPFNTVFTTYRNFVLGGADKKADSKFDSVEDHHKALGAIGLAGEAGEVLDLYKKQFFHTKEPENYRDKLVKELGDVMWYFVLKCAAEGITVDEVIYENMKKLVLRYPDRHPELVEQFK
jgi:NTP pyrophosphatase (non-canonical NTP hydrolase)